MATFPWQCPFCGHHSTIGEDDWTSSTGFFNDGNKYGRRSVIWSAITCRNVACREYSFNVWIRDSTMNPGGAVRHGPNTQHEWQLVPAANMKILPDFIPAAIVADYKEACQIAKLSPKASATLARRCLQGMIRDFWGVKAGRLVDEIQAIHDKVDGDAWTAIEGVRTIGNIGAHMEADINVIVDVDPGEAKLLIELVETLVDEWYVSRKDRKERFAKLTKVAEEKAAARKPGDE